MENHHRNSGFSHEKWWIFPVRYVSHYQRVSRKSSSGTLKIISKKKKILKFTPSFLVEENLKSWRNTIRKKTVNKNSGCHGRLLSWKAKIRKKPYLISACYPLIIKHGLFVNIPLTKFSISWGVTFEKSPEGFYGLESLEFPLLIATFYWITIYIP